MRKRRLITVLVIVLVLLAVAVAYAYRHRSLFSPPSTRPYGENSSTAAAAAFDKQHFSTTDPASPWVVVNKQHRLNPVKYAPSDLTPVGNGQQMRAAAAAALQHMFSDAQAAGFTLIADSGYRSYDEQTDVYTSMVATYGQAHADTVSARPGYSEHQTGWAVDIGTEGCQITDCFGSTPAGKWAVNNAYKYGFVLRYPANLTNITGYSNEAWHFRYVGPQLAEELHKDQVRTLEQFFGIKGGTHYR